MESLEVVLFGPTEAVPPFVSAEPFVDAVLDWVDSAAVVEGDSVTLVVADGPVAADPLALESSPPDSVVVIVGVFDDSPQPLVHAASACWLGELAEHEALTARSNTTGNLAGFDLVVA